MSIINNAGSELNSCCLGFVKKQRVYVTLSLLSLSFVLRVCLFLCSARVNTVRSEPGLTCGCESHTWIGKVVRALPLEPKASLVGRTVSLSLVRFTLTPAHDNSCWCGGWEGSFAGFSRSTALIIRFYCSDREVFAIWKRLKVSQRSQLERRREGNLWRHCRAPLAFKCAPSAEKLPAM